MELWSHFFGLEACMRAASRLVTAGVAMLVCGVGAAGAQGAKTNTEVGTSVGVTILSVSGGGGSVTHVGIPADGAFQSVSLSGGGGSVSGPGLGGALGYRFKVRNNLAIRLDGRYRRWFSDFKDLNEIGFGLGLGATF